MSEKKSKQLKKFSAEYKCNYKIIKQIYRRCPWPLRHIFFQMIKKGAEHYAISISKHPA